VNQTIPNLRIVIAACAIAVLGYAIFSGWVVFYSNDAAQRGDVIGTWKSFAVAAFTFWIGSSSAGKAKDATGDPQPVTVQNKPGDPVQVQEQP
jgi:hypothetical protein